MAAVSAAIWVAEETSTSVTTSESPLSITPISGLSTTWGSGCFCDEEQADSIAKATAATASICFAFIIFSFLGG